jgi:hypothetical protein
MYKFRFEKWKDILFLLDGEWDVGFRIFNFGFVLIRYWERGMSCPEMSLHKVNMMKGKDICFSQAWMLNRAGFNRSFAALLTISILIKN